MEEKQNEQKLMGFLFFMIICNRCSCTESFCTCESDIKESQRRQKKGLPQETEDEKLERLYAERDEDDYNYFED
jgi:hypothetical protein